MASGDKRVGLVRHVLRDPPRYERDRAERERKALEKAAKYNHPTADVDQMLQEIKDGYMMR